MHNDISYSRHCDKMRNIIEDFKTILENCEQVCETTTDNLKFERRKRSKQVILELLTMFQEDLNNDHARAVGYVEGLRNIDINKY